MIEVTIWYEGGGGKERNVVARGGADHDQSLRNEFDRIPNKVGKEEFIFRRDHRRRERTS